MSGGPKRNSDKINIIGIIVIGISASVLVYVSITALQAFYSNNSSDVQTVADYGGQETMAKTLRADQTRNITEPHSNGKGTFSIHIKDAMAKVVTDLKADPANAQKLVPAIGPSDKPTIQSIFGRPKPLNAQPAAGDGAGAAVNGTGGAPTTNGAPQPAAGSAAPAAGTGSAGGAQPGNVAPSPTPTPTGPTRAGAGSNG